MEQEGSRMRLHLSFCYTSRSGAIAWQTFCSLAKFTDGGLSEPVADSSGRELYGTAAGRSHSQERFSRCRWREIVSGCNLSHALRTLVRLHHRHIRQVAVELVVIEAEAMTKRSGFRSSGTPPESARCVASCDQKGTTASELGAAGSVCNR